MFPDSNIKEDAMKSLIVTVLMSAVAISTVSATAQYPDNIIYEGKEYKLHTNSMEPYFAKHPDKRPASEISSSALWRGYTATFELKSKVLMLKDIRIMYADKKKEELEDYSMSWKSVKDKLIPKGKELKIDWFSGILVLPHGEMVDNVHMGYGSTFSHYILLEITQGKLTGKRAYDHTQYSQFRTKQYNAYKKTEEYAKHATRLKKEGWTQKAIDSFLSGYIVKYTSKFLDKQEAPSKPDTGVDE